MGPVHWSQSGRAGAGREKPALSLILRDQTKLGIASTDARPINSTKEMTMEKKIIAVLGATGAQGGGLVRAILADPTGGFAVRALTRDPETAKARELSALGAEVVAANVDDADSLTRAFKGAYGAFCVTFFWDHFSVDKEVAQVQAMASAAKTAGLKHVIWSTLEDTRLLVPLSDDRMPTLHGK